jgi:GST-like protein
MADSQDYAPPKVWTWAKPNGGTFANINRPIAGPTHDAADFDTKTQDKLAAEQA